MSTPVPRYAERWSPCWIPSRRRRTFHSNRRSSASGAPRPRRVRRPTGRGAAGAPAQRPHLRRDRRGSDGVVEDRVGGHPVGERLEREHDSMAQDLVGQIEHIRRQRIVTPADVGECTCSEDQVDRPTRADAVVDVLREATEAGLGEVTSDAGEAHRELDRRRIDVHPVRLALRGEQPVGREHRLHGLGRGHHPFDDDELLRRRRVADDDLHHESVDLCLRQRVRALRLDRVLRGEHEERMDERLRSRPIVTCRSCITSSSALCTLAGARLISSARMQVGEYRPRRAETRQSAGGR